MSSGKWTPIEPRPEMMNEFLRKAGVKRGWHMRCIHGLDSIRVGLTIPDQTKASAFIFAYECTEDVRSESVRDIGNVDRSTLFFIQQPDGEPAHPSGFRECAALIHAVANGVGLEELDPGGMMAKFITETMSLGPAQRGEALTKAAEDSESILDAYRQVTGGHPDYHTEKLKNWRHVAVVRHLGTLFELDPLKPGPVAHGPSLAATFARDAAKICEELLISANPSTCSKHLKFSFFGLVCGPFEDDLFAALRGADGVASNDPEGDE